MSPAVQNFLWDVVALALICPLAGYAIMKLSEELDKAKKSKSKVKIWGVYSVIAFSIMFFIKRF